mgnify:CR=1 FL=1
MIDIKSLFLAAKNSGSESDVSAYLEAVKQALESPRDYVAQLEYIIQSSTGINTLIPFIEYWGLPIAAYDTVYECVTTSLEKAKDAKVDTHSYEEAKKFLEEFRQDNIKGFMMFEYYRPDDVRPYINTYYGMTKGKQNRYLASGMLQKFGECAIPDAYITALRVSRQPYSPNMAVPHLETYIGSHMNLTPLANQFIIGLRRTGTGEIFMNECAFMIVSNMHKEHQKVFREAMIMGNEDAVYEYTQKQIDALHDLISFYEYYLTWSDEIRMDTDHISKVLTELCEEINQINTESDADIAEMLPQPKTEAPAWMAQTSDKKHSTVAPYLKRNHDITSWGEEEPKEDKPESDKDLDDYKHPDEDDKPASTPSDTSITDDISDEEHPPRSNQTSSGPVNYYYYTYQNSLNKNDHSFNQTDDHSSDKHVNSHNDGMPKPKVVIKDDNNENDDSINTESMKQPWELDLGIPEVFNEAAKPVGEAAKDDLWSDDEEDRVGSADKDKPESDHPIKDVLMDIDRKFTKVQQHAKKGVQNVVNVGRAAVKPAKRTKQWVDNMITSWNDTKETKIKERLAEPKERMNLIKALHTSIRDGALFKAGLLLNPFLLGIRILSHNKNSKKEQRLKNEMILELQQEEEIIKEKIKDAEQKNDYQAKYQLMRFQTELKKKLWRVAGNKNVVNMI